MSRAVVLDIEGTTSSAAHVHQVLFPYARDRMARWITTHRGEPDVEEILTSLRRDLDLPASTNARAEIRALERWSDEDCKAAPLKRLQGLIWAEGYARGELSGHVYPDTVQAMAAWQADGVSLYIYSSGSVQAQQLWFSHSPFGDLRHQVTGYFDAATAGPKHDPSSYQVIASEIGTPARHILFASDSTGELDAARASGWQTVLIRRLDDPAPLSASAEGGAGPAAEEHRVCPDLLHAVDLVPT